MMPERTPGESKEAFVKRCMDDRKMLEEFDNVDQRYAVCMKYAEASNDATDTIEMSEMIGSENAGDFGTATDQTSTDSDTRGRYGSDTEESGQAEDARTASEEAASGSENQSVEDAAATETVEALQYGRPGPNDPRKTPAKPSERRKGSKRNPPGSAKKPNPSIQVSEETRKRLQSLMSEHNKSGKGSRASMGALLTVYRRGAGAFSRSHAPNMSRGGWGIARVKAFLYLLRNGRPSNPNYKQDNDLLPKGHPRSRKATATEEHEMNAEAVEYQGRQVTLNKPFRTKGAAKKFAVYVKNESGNVVIVRFGDPNMEIKRDDPGRRKNFRSRHNCDSPGPKWKARYWSCKMWESSKSVTDYTANEDEHEALADDLWFDIWSATEGEIFDGIEEVIESSECGCGGDCCDDDELTDGMIAGFDEGDFEESYGVCAEPMCAGCPDCAIDVVEAAECDVCPPGYLADENGVCIAVTCDLDIESFEAVLEAATGKTMIRMKGVAFTHGFNKNGWSITKGAAVKVAKNMIGADVTLNHPKIEHGRFRRNMDGGVDEATVGVVTEARMEDDEDEKDGYRIKFTAEVHREELFAALESGLWLREGYGVSIGGTGIPTAMEEDEKGRMKMVFGGDFTFDHLAIVHKPAYPGARIESVERVQVEVEASTFTYPPEHGTVQQAPSEASIMSEEITNVEASHDEAAELREALVLANARIAEFEKTQAQAAEVARSHLVTKASELGLSGHEDFTSEMLERVIASWEAARPAPREMTPAVPAKTEAVAEASEAPKKSEKVVANYLNGEKVESEESAYRIAWNAWASAWNGNLSTLERDEMRAPMFDDLKEMI